MLPKVAPRSNRGQATAQQADSSFYLDGCPNPYYVVGQARGFASAAIAIGSAVQVFYLSRVPVPKS